MNLTEFLLDRTAERGQAARDWLESKGVDDNVAWSVAGYITTRCDALRRAVLDGRLTDSAIRQHAARYADHPDFDESWRA